MNDYIDKQELILSKALDYIKSCPDHSMMALIEIERNIMDLKEEAKDCKEDDLPGILQQLNLQHQLAEKFTKSNILPDKSSPYFGHMKIKQGDKEKDIFLGHCAMMNHKLDFKIVDWKKAPISRIFYQCAEGDEFDFDIDERTIEGVIIEKSIITIRDGKLLRIDRNGNSFVRRDGQWSSLHEKKQVLAGGEGLANQELSFGQGNTNFDSPEVISLLDKIQYEIINLPANKPLLVTGGAGSGKTTVALFRLAKLCERNELRPNDILILVPNAGLIKLSQTILAKVGLGRVDVKVNDFYIKELALKNIRGLPRKISYEAPISVCMVKRSDHMVDLIDIYIEKQIMKVRSDLVKDCDEQVLSYFDSLSHYPIIERMKRLARSNQIGTLEKVKISKISKDLDNYIDDLFAIYTDRELLTRLINLTDRKINPRIIDEFYEYSSKQLQSFDSEEDYLDRTQNKKSKSGRLDFEDLPILIDLVTKKRGSLYHEGRNTKLYKHVFIDEAQELSNLELRSIAKGKAEKSNVTVAGDAVQQIDPTISFKSWKNTMDNLGVEFEGAKELNVSYRSPAEIVDFAHHVLGPIAPVQKPESKRYGGPILRTQVQHREHASMMVSDALVELSRREPRASIAIICNTEQFAELFYNELADVGGVRLVIDQDFSLRPGIDVTTVDQIRGLEFDYVILPDLDRLNYPENNRARKRLHLAATRAIHQLWILYPNDRSTLI